jgi:hypothetical protein
MRNYLNSPSGLLDSQAPKCQAFSFSNHLKLANSQQKMFWKIPNVLPFLTDPFILEKNLVTLAALENLDCIVSSSNTSGS